jgi:hypothetical protein
MKKNTTKKVLNYAAMSAAILGTADAATGQVVYTDIDDVSLDTADAFYQVDFDGDAVLDINLGVTNFTGGPGATARGSDGTSFNGNGIVGEEAGGFYYPSNLAAGVTVDAGSPVLTSVRGDMYVYACYSNSLWCGEVTDGYVGASFDVGGNTHYGWVRLDILSNGTGGFGTMIIKDFAYESTPDTAIETGDEGVLGVNEQAFANFNFFASNEQLNLSAANAMSNVTVYTILGQQVTDQKLSGTNETVNISALSTGVYVAKVSIDGAVKTIKFAKK